MEIVTVMKAATMMIMDTKLTSRGCFDFVFLFLTTMMLGAIPMMTPTSTRGLPSKAFHSSKRDAVALTSTPSAKVSLEKTTTKMMAKMRGTMVTVVRTKLPTR